MNKPHGEFSIKVEGNVVHAYASEAFNTEGAAAFFNAVMKQGRPLGRWVLQVHISEDAGITPEVMEFTVKEIAGLNALGCLGIVSQLETKLMEHLTRAVYKRQHVAHLISNDPKEISDFIEGLLQQ